MGRVASYMVQRNFPPGLARRVKIYFRRLFAATTAIDDSSVLDGLSASLRVEVIERDRRHGAVGRTIGSVDWAIDRAIVRQMIGRSDSRTIDPTIGRSDDWTIDPTIEQSDDPTIGRSIDRI